jgi:hypothetical protein
VLTCRTLAPECETTAATRCGATYRSCPNPAARSRRTDPSPTTPSSTNTASPGTTGTRAAPPSAIAPGAVGASQNPSATSGTRRSKPSASAPTTPDSPHGSVATPGGRSSPPTPAPPPDNRDISRCPDGSHRAHHHVRLGVLARPAARPCVTRTLQNAYPQHQAQRSQPINGAARPGRSPYDRKSA